MRPQRSARAGGSGPTRSLTSAAEAARAVMISRRSARLSGRRRERAPDEAREVRLQPRDQPAALVELTRRGSGSLEPAQCGDVRAQVRRDPGEGSIELRAWRHVAPSRAGIGARGRGAAGSGSIAEDLASVLDQGLVKAAARRWEQAMDRRLEEIRDGRAPWRSSEDVRREALEALGDVEHLGPDRLEWLVHAGHRLRPWPDSPAALRVLGERFKLVALSNASLAELADVSARGRLAWHAVLSGALVEGYKPSPKVYELAIGRLALEPSRTLMVAAHAWVCAPPRPTAYEQPSSPLRAPIIPGTRIASISTSTT
jgi:2-haloalkanoic acid dehalogenase type II